MRLGLIRQHNTLSLSDETGNSLCVYILIGHNMTDFISLSTIGTQSGEAVVAEETSARASCLVVYSPVANLAYRVAKMMHLQKVLTPVYST